MGYTRLVRVAVFVLIGQKKKRAREQSLALLMCHGPAALSVTRTRRTLLLHAVFALEAFDAAGGIDQLLLAGEERMTIGADVHMDCRHRRARFNDIAARAHDLRRLVLRMYTLFH